MVSNKNSNEDWLRWCRLCANEDTDGSVNIFQKTKNESGAADEMKFCDFKEKEDFDLAVTIEKHFSVKVNHDEKLPDSLCPQCFSKLHFVVAFEKRVQKVQKMFDAILNAPTESQLDFHTIRLKYELGDTFNEQALQGLCCIEIKSEKNNYTEDPLQILDAEVKEENISTSEKTSNGNETAIIKQCNATELKDQKRNKRKIKDVIDDSVTLDDSAGDSDSDFECETSEKAGNATDTIYECTKCPQKFKRFYAYRKHLNRKHLPCPQCPKIFMTEEQLKQHSLIHLPMEIRKKYFCPNCEKSFTSDSTLQTHIKHVHLNECPYICEECGEQAASIQILKYHMLKHNNETPFECELCKKRFKNKGYLKKHMVYHDNIDYICNECGLRLKCATTLKRHMVVHSNELKYKCDHCGRGFKRAKTLKNHLLLHTGLKPYSCGFCHLTFASGPNCRQHRKKSHPEELAAQEAAGGGKTFTKNIPKLRTLIETTKNSNFLLPVVSKPSGNFQYKKNPKGKTSGNQTKTQTMEAETIP